MQMQKRKFRIGDLAQKLHVDKFVIRFWEKEFTISPCRSDGGQRFYEEKDLETFQQIKTLLYEKKFTIAGAKKQLTLSNKTQASIHANKNQIYGENIIASQKTNIHGNSKSNNNTGSCSDLSSYLSYSSDTSGPNYVNNIGNTQKLDAKTVKKLVALRKNLFKLRELLS